jgi:hypothetical protein
MWPTTTCFATFVSFVALDYVQVVQDPEFLRVDRLVESVSSDSL